MPKKRRKQKKSIVFPGRKKIVIPALAGVLLLLVIFFARSLFINSDSLFTVAVAKKSGDIELFFVDFKKDLLTSVRIPESTEVNLALQRGTLRASSAWRLVESEDLPGQIVADTVMRTFHIPVDYWASEQAINGLTPGETNLPLTSRLRLMFATKGNFDKIDLSETSYLTDTSLVDGEEGYKINGTLPLIVASLAADDRIASGQTAVLAINSTGEPNYSLADAISVFEVLGGKVAPVLEGAPLNIECIVRAQDKNMRSRVARIFNCKQETAEPESFDIEVVFGKYFLKRF